MDSAPAVNEYKTGDKVLCVKKCCNDNTPVCVIIGMVYTISEDSIYTKIKEIAGAFRGDVFVPATPENIQRYKFSDRLEGVLNDV